MRKFVKILIKKALCLVRGVKTGSNTFISPRAEIAYPKNIILGKNVVIEHFSRIIANGETAGIEIGDNTYIHPYALIKTNGGEIKIGKGSTVNDYAVLYGHGGLTIGNDTHIAAHVVIVPANHLFSDPDIPISKQGETKKGIRIGDDVCIGAGAVFLDGVNIGKGAVVAAGAVVTKSVPEYSVAAGVPAKVIKERKKEKVL
ncbi:MAG: DapH/DapD/GlmU-related protein [Candidatus Firestonebacteria bacterium]